MKLYFWLHPCKIRVYNLSLSRFLCSSVCVVSQIIRKKKNWKPRMLLKFLSLFTVIWMCSAEFSCDGQVDGSYYADPETDCQAFHVCINTGVSVFLFLKDILSLHCVYCVMCYVLLGEYID